MSMLIISFMFLVGLMFGFFTGFNVYRIIFLVLVMFLIDIVLISLEITFTGSATGSANAIGEKVLVASGMFHLFSGVVGMFAGMYLKQKSTEYDNREQGIEVKP